MSPAGRATAPREEILRIWLGGAFLARSLAPSSLRVASRRPVGFAGFFTFVCRVVLRLNLERRKWRQAASVCMCLLCCLVNVCSDKTISFWAERRDRRLSGVAIFWKASNIVFSLMSFRTSYDSMWRKSPNWKPFDCFAQSCFTNYISWNTGS